MLRLTGLLEENSLKISGDYNDEFLCNEFLLITSEQDMIKGKIEECQWKFEYDSKNKAIKVVDDFIDIFIVNDIKWFLIFCNDCPHFIYTGNMDFKSTMINVMSKILQE